MMDEIAEIAENTVEEITEIADANSKQVAEIGQIEDSMRQLVEKDRSRGRLADRADD